MTLTAQASGTNVAAPATITLAAGASDSDVSVAKVEFFNGSTTLGGPLPTRRPTAAAPPA